MEENFENNGVATKVAGTNGSEFGLPVKVGMWTKVKNFLFQEVKVELTSGQQKVENEINEFLHQEINFGKLHDFLFQDISIGKKEKTRV